MRKIARKSTNKSGRRNVFLTGHKLLVYLRYILNEIMTSQSAERLSIINRQEKASLIWAIADKLVGVSNM